MKIVFLVKFYEPFDRGGSEWSTRDLAKLLSDSGHQIIVVTPNYGAPSNEKIDGINIHRIPFPIKLKNPKAKIAPYWTNNIIWFIYSAVYCTYFCLVNEVDIVHVHSNEFIPAAVNCKIILRKSTLVTFRDYQTLCSLGFCMWDKEKSCTFAEFVTNDFPFFYENYITNRNMFVKTILFIAAIRSMIMQKIIYFLAKKIDIRVAVSKKVAKIFNANKIFDINVIHNPVLITSNPSNRHTNEILYVGKLSKGKGVDILLKIIKDLTLLIPDAKFKLIGSGYLEKNFKSYIRKNHLLHRVKLEGQIDHKDVLKQIRQAALVVVPSTWQEPLPRSVIEALESGTPVVATNVGGIPEVMQNNLYGILADPEVDSVKKSIVEGFKKRDLFRKHLEGNMKKLRNLFSKNVLRDYEKLYKEALNK